MSERLFVIAIGGTGMRCLESFVHVCAMGMFDDSEINILALDTDLENGNFVRVQQLIEEGYLRAKGFNKPHYAVADSFFTARINFFKFSPDYSKDNSGNLRKLSKLIDAPDLEKQLFDLLFTENVQGFDLKHGYRAQTHLGSTLMYHAILEDVKGNTQGDLGRFIEEMFNASEAGATKAFVLGSVFGGTGASAIPIIPKAFNDALAIKMPGKSLNKVYFGATLLTGYFTFPAPDSQNKAKQKIIADAKNFALNSQAAMMFYEDDETVKTTYQKFYMLGTPTIDFRGASEGTETITGGAKQLNDDHFIELLSAFAAYDFLKTPGPDLARIKNETKAAQYYFRTIDDSRLDFEDFVSEADIQKFIRQFACLTSTSFIVLLYDFVEQARGGILKKENILGYEDIAKEEVDALKKYFRMFHFALQDGVLRDGWLRQIHRSAGGGGNFLFNPDIFGCTNEKEMRKLDSGKLFPKGAYDKHNADTGILTSHFDQFKKKFKEVRDGDLTNRCEKLVQRMYHSVRAIHHFNA